MLEPGGPAEHEHLARPRRRGRRLGRAGPPASPASGSRRSRTALAAAASPAARVLSSAAAAGRRRRAAAAPAAGGACCANPTAPPTSSAVHATASIDVVAILILITCLPKNRPQTRRTLQRKRRPRSSIGFSKTKNSATSVYVVLRAFQFFSVPSSSALPCPPCARPPCAARAQNEKRICNCIVRGSRAPLTAPKPARFGVSRVGSIEPSAQVLRIGHRLVRRARQFTVVDRPFHITAFGALKKSARICERAGAAEADRSARSPDRACGCCSPTGSSGLIRARRCPASAR